MDICLVSFSKNKIKILFSTPLVIGWKFYQFQKNTRSLNEKFLMEEGKLLDWANSGKKFFFLFMISSFKKSLRCKSYMYKNTFTFVIIVFIILHSDTFKFVNNFLLNYFRRRFVSTFVMQCWLAVANLINRSWNILCYNMNQM